MPTYYGQIPGASVTAEIEAPDTRHGRTVFLDYLSRQGFIPHGKRQFTRKQIIMQRMEPGQIPTSIQLDYDQVPEPKQLPIRSEYHDGDPYSHSETTVIRAVEPPHRNVAVYEPEERFEQEEFPAEVSAGTMGGYGREFVPRRIRPY